jgi:hypothetical protein
MDKYLEQNRRLWNELTPIHERSDGIWRLEGDKIPLTFSLKATKP